MDNPAVDEVFARARQAQRSGELNAARTLYGEILLDAPMHAGALHGLGLVEFKSGNANRAVELISRAIECEPQLPNAQFNRGNVYKSMERFSAAAACYQQAIALAPADAEAYNNLGIVLQALGRLEAAASSFERATVVDQSYVQAHLNLGFARREMGDAPAAMSAFQRALELTPDSIDVLTIVAELAGELRQFELAASIYATVIEREPANAAAHVRQGLAREQLGQWLPALDSFARARTLGANGDDGELGAVRVLRHLGRSPEALAILDAILAANAAGAEPYYLKAQCLYETDQFADALSAAELAVSTDPLDPRNQLILGDVLNALKRHEAALQSYDRAVTLDASLGEAHNRRGIALRRLHRLEDALAAFDAAIRADGGSFSALANRAGVLLDLRQFVESGLAIDRAMSIEPDSKVLLVSRSEVHRAMSRPSMALSDLDRVVALDPADASAWGLRGHVLADLQRYADAVESYSAALAINPDIEFLPGLRLMAKLSICDWQDFGAEWHALSARVASGDRVLAPFASLVLSSSAQLQRKVAEIFVAARIPENDAQQPAPPYRNHSKIRLGYFSADLFEHATTHLMIDLFERHDRTKFELIAFSFGPDIRDAVRTRVERAFDQFHDVRGLTDAEIVALSRKLEIDIAVDLKGYTAHYRPGIFARRAAPVQASYLGYPGTTALHAMDYVIADETVIPPEHRQHYSEKVAYLPLTYQPNDSRRSIGSRIFRRDELGLSEDAFVYCCFNNNFKILPAMFARWMRILAAVDGSVLWLLGDNESVRTRLAKSAKEYGIDPNRLIFAKRLPPDEHLARHRAADLFLDTLPYNAHTTASDALWTGLPVLTLVGDSFASRVAASLLRAANVPELVVYTEQEYFERAVSYAAEPALLAALRDRLNQDREHLGLFDAARFTADIEALYGRMHERNLQGESSEHLTSAR